MAHFIVPKFNHRFVDLFWMFQKTHPPPPPIYGPVTYESYLHQLEREKQRMECEKQHTICKAFSLHEEQLYEDACKVLVTHPEPCIDCDGRADLVCEECGVKCCNKCWEEYRVIEYRIEEKLCRDCFRADITIYDDHARCEHNELY